LGFSWDLTVEGTVFWTTGVVVIGLTTCSGVFVVVTVGEDSILSIDSCEEVLPVLVNFGDWSRRTVDGDCECGCKIGVCLDCLAGVSFDGVDDDRLEIIFVDV
jgi:hypothetical protein